MPGHDRAVTVSKMLSAQKYDGDNKIDEIIHTIGGR
jgi:hypothetical protein